MTAHPFQPKPLPTTRICVALSDRSVSALLQTSASLLPEFPFQELRLDSLPDPAANLPAIAAHISTHSVSTHSGATFLATCRTRQSGGNFKGSAEQELAILTEAARSGCAWVDLALESAELLGPRAIAQLRGAGARVLLSWHDFHRTGDLQAVLERMRPFAPDLCKVVPTAERLRDNLVLLQLFETINDTTIHTLNPTTNASQTPVVALAMGEAGLPSRVLGPRTGSAFTFASAAPSQTTAPGQLDARTLRDLYRVERIGPATSVYGVAGDPIRSSLSPLMQNTAFAHTGMDAVYLPLLTHDSAELFEVASVLGLAGCSITMPLKQAVLPLLHRVDPLAASIGAVNTLRREPNGTLSGFNTDAAGITDPLEHRISLPGARVLVLGAGGAARAAVFACTARGARVSIFNRTRQSADHLAKQTEAIAVSRADLLKSSFDVLINATPAGMSGNPTSLPLAPDEINAALVFDLVYNPLETPLLQLARQRGLETIAGVEMFVHQGARQFELWTGAPAPLSVMRQVVLEALATRGTSS